MSALDSLIGKSLVGIDIGVGQTIDLSNSRGEFFSLPTLFNFSSEYRLEVNCKSIITGSTSDNLNENYGAVVARINEDDESFYIELSNGNVITIFKRKIDISEPEMMCLYGPNDLIVVWENKGLG